MIGATLLNRYALTAPLGQGGMGVVYRAHDRLLDRDVAVKILSRPGLSGEGRDRLLREARAAARLNHPNIVGVYDAGEAEFQDLSRGSEGEAVGTAAFIIMELVEGQSLYERGSLPLDSTLSVARQICAALEHAHRHGIVHRDLKPENVILTPDGAAKLMDFGLARSAVPSRDTPEGAVIGTVFYLAPEQALGQEVDGRADLYALGVMLYELTTGRLPFSGDDPLIILSQHLHAPVPPPSLYRPDLPPALEAVIVQLLAKNPADRFASASEVAAALTEALDGRLPASPPLVRNNLPAAVTRFVGRERELAEVRRLLTDARLVTLTGSGGCGKTRLALQLAETLRQAGGADRPYFPDGLWLVELAPISDPALVPQTVAARLNVREEPGHPVTQTLVDTLRPRTLLLILDNCEHLIDACARLAETLLRACPNVKILASSREALGIAGETAFRVPSLPTPDPAYLPPLAALAEFDAVRLFVDRVALARPDFQLAEANAAAVAQICHRLDGLPLALELAAARARVMTIEQIAARLDDRFRLLTGGSRTALPRQQTLRALIDWSWDLLSGAERTLLRRLAVFIGGWTLEAAEKVASDEPPTTGATDPAPQRPSLAAADILETLNHLVDKSLVLVEEPAGAPRYRLLETIRQYAREKLLEAGEAEAVRGRHLAYYAELTEQAESGLRGAGQLAWLERLEAEHDNLRAALKWSLHGGPPESGLRLAGNVARFWYLHGYWREGRAWLQDVLAQKTTPPTDADRRARARALAGAGWLADEDGSEVAFYEESLALCHALGDRWGAAFALRGLGSSATLHGDLDRATACLEESLALFRELDDVWGCALALYNLGWVAINRDSAEPAQSHWEEALALFRRSGDRWGIAVTLGALGYLARQQGDYRRTMALSEEGLALFRELGDKAGIAVSLVRLGNLAFRRGDYRQALELLEKGLDLNRERGDSSGMMTALGLIGLVACYQGDYARARTLLEEAVALGRELSNPYDLPVVMSYLGLTAYYQGDLERAAAWWQDSLALNRQYDNRAGVGFALNGLGLVALRRGDLAQAETHLQPALAAQREGGDRRHIATVLHDLGRLALAAGDAVTAAGRLCESLTLRKQLGDRQGLAETLEALATARLEQPRLAARLLGAAEALRAALGAPVPAIERADLERDLAALRAALGDAEFEAEHAAGRALPVEKAVSLALEQRHA